MNLPMGTYIDTPIDEYRKWPALNYSALADFNESQDHALMERPAKSYFEEGTAFELMIEDSAKSTKKFDERFFVADAPGTMPEGLAQWIEDKEDLKSKYRFNKDGSLNKQSDRMHKWLDECQRNPGKMPMGKDRFEMLEKMVSNFMLMQPFIDVGTENTLAEILGIAHFQVPIIWYVGKIRKKALVDCMIETENRIYAFDIKTAADIKRFVWILKDKYWIQDCHYSAGLGMIFPGKEIVWRFLVASKAAPYISQTFKVSDGSYDATRGKYFELCTRYQAWTDEGKPPRGWKDLKTVPIFFD